MIIYDPQFHKIEEIYTDSAVNLDSVNRMIANPRELQCLRARRRYLKVVSHHVKEKYNGEDWEAEETSGELLDDKRSLKPAQPKKMLANDRKADVDQIYEKIEGMKKKAKNCRENSTLTTLEVSNKLLDTLGNNPSKQTVTTEITSQSHIDTQSLNADIEFAASDRALQISPKSFLATDKIMIGQTRQNSLEDSTTKIPEFSMPIDDLCDKFSLLNEAIPNDSDSHNFLDEGFIIGMNCLNDSMEFEKE